jgi:hypothetical protein
VRSNHRALSVICRDASSCPLLDQSGQRRILARDGLFVNDPKRTLARPLQETNPSQHDGCSEARELLASTTRRQQENPNYSTGASNCAHHFGRARAGTFAEQLILHDCVSHANRPLLLTVASGAAAALAAGDDNEGGPEGEGICGSVGPATGWGSFLGDKSPVAHPASAKTSKAAACLMTFT